VFNSNNSYCFPAAEMLAIFEEKPQSFQRNHVKNWTMLLYRYEGYL